MGLLIQWLSWPQYLILLLSVINISHGFGGTGPQISSHKIKMSDDFVYAMVGEADINPEHVIYTRSTNFSNYLYSYFEKRTQLDIFKNTCKTYHFHTVSPTQYQLYDGKRSRKHAQTFCKKEGGFLPEIRDFDQATHLTKLMKSNDISRIHSGISSDEGKILFEDGTPARNIFFEKVCLQNSKQSWNDYRTKWVDTWTWTYLLTTDNDLAFPCPHQVQDQHGFNSDINLPTICMFQDMDIESNEPKSLFSICNNFAEKMEQELERTVDNMSVLFPNFADEDNDNFSNTRSGTRNQRSLPLAPFAATASRLFMRALPVVLSSVQRNDFKILTDFLKSDSKTEHELTMLKTQNKLVQEKFNSQLNEIKNSLTLQQFQLKCHSFYDDFHFDLESLNHGAVLWLDIISQTRGGKTPLSILSPKTFKEIRDQVWHDKSILLTSQLSSVRTRVSMIKNEYFIIHNIRTQVPPQRVQLYKVFPLPTFDNETNLTFTPEMPTNNLAILSGTESGVFLEHQEMSDCLGTPTKCQASEPVGNYLQHCAIAQFFDIKKNCSFHAAKGLNPLFKSISGHVIYSFPKTVTASAECASAVNVAGPEDSFKLIGKGLIQTAQGCILSIPEINLKLLPLNNNVYAFKDEQLRPTIIRTSQQKFKTEPVEISNSPNELPLYDVSKVSAAFQKTQYTMPSDSMDTYLLIALGITVLFIILLNLFLGFFILKIKNQVKKNPPYQQQIDNDQVAYSVKNSEVCTKLSYIPKYSNNSANEYCDPIGGTY